MLAATVQGVLISIVAGSVAVHFFFTGMRYLYRLLAVQTETQRADGQSRKERRRNQLQRRLLVASPIFDGVENMRGVTSLSDRGGAYDRGVYVCESKDMDDKHQLLKPEVYNLSFEQLGVLQGNLLGYVSAQMRSLRTNGNGACGMHAVFVALEPARTGGLELFAPDARNLAAQHLGPSLEDL